jgi:FixJ family two-component response regulator
VSIDHPLIAVVDDDASVCTGVKRLLRSAGLETATYSSGIEFLASLETTMPDCAVLDIRMPQMTGLEVLGKVRARGLTLPVIFITAEERLERKGDAIVAGGFAFLQKPFDGDLLVATVMSALGSSRKA